MTDAHDTPTGVADPPPVVSVLANPPVADMSGTVRPGRRWPRVTLAGVAFDACTEPELIDHVMACLDAGVGGQIVTPNIDILRTISHDATVQTLVGRADVVVADGMPLVWAAALAGTPLPARVPGSDLIWSLSAALARSGRGVFLLGGDAGVPERAGTVLAERYPGLRVAGTDSPPYGFDRDPALVEAVVARVAAARPDLVFVGLGFPRQEQLMARLAAACPSAWLLGCGASIPFVAGTLQRAPGWMQRAGVEWLHRLVREPRRLFTRYVVRDAPFAARLLSAAIWSRRRVSR